MPNPGELFKEVKLPVEALASGGRLAEWLFPRDLCLCQYIGSKPSEKLAVLTHGLAQNEDYFGLLAPELLARGFDVWAFRLPGYTASGKKPSAWPESLGELSLSIGWFGWMLASAMAHLEKTLNPRPTFTLAWGHSMGGAILGEALQDHVTAEWAGPSLAVFETPAFQECIGPLTNTFGGITILPDAMLERFAQLFLIDDVRANDYSRKLLATVALSRTSRLNFNRNALALINPLNHFPTLSSALLDRSRFLIAEYDRLVEVDDLQALLDKAEVPQSHRKVFKRNHCLSLTSAPEMAAWLDGNGL